MKKIITLIILFFTFYSYSQILENEISSANHITTIYAYFYKNTWKPFSGNVIMNIDYKNQKHLAKTKYENGFEVFTEITNPQTKKIVFCQRYKNIHLFETAVYDSINVKTAFKNNEKFTDTTLLKYQTVTNYFLENKERTKLEALNGFVKSEKTKTYFANGMKVKVELFYDSDLKRIKESYKIFHTKIGNIDSNEENSLTYDGEFKKWDVNGKLIEEGKYKEGKKILKK